MKGYRKVLIAVNGSQEVLRGGPSLELGPLRAARRDDGED